ncbi:SUF system NifU family Fe-S cluster assembly protein [Mycoplasmatota bacterium WC44]
MSDLNNLYRQVIMDHYKNPRNKGLVEDEGYKKFHIKNPSCGDDITIQAKVDDGVIEDIKHEGTGCSICCSSASVMSETVKGKKVEETSAVIENYYNMIKGKKYDEDLDMGDAVVYSGVAKFPARVKCATIAWQALEESIKTDE